MQDRSPHRSSSPANNFEQGGDEPDSHDKITSTQLVSFIKEAINSSPKKALSIQEIYTWLQTNYPSKFQSDEEYFAHNQSARLNRQQQWKNNVRYTLSTRRDFYKHSPKKNGTRGSQWMITEETGMKPRERRHFTAAGIKRPATAQALPLQPEPKLPIPRSFERRRSSDPGSHLNEFLKRRFSKDPSLFNANANSLDEIPFLCDFSLPRPSISQYHNELMAAFSIPQETNSNGINSSPMMPSWNNSRKNSVLYFDSNSDLGYLLHQAFSPISWNPSD